MNLLKPTDHISAQPGVWDVTYLENQLRLIEQSEGAHPDSGPTKLFDEAIALADLPPVRFVAGGLVVSDELVRHADENTPRRRYRRWTKYPYPPGEPRGICIGKDRLLIEQYQGLWLIFRLSHVSRDYERLCLLVGPAVICSRTPEAAERVAVYYQLIEPAKRGGVGWMPQ
jgi:hypothetical protein